MKSKYPMAGVALAASFLLFGCTHQAGKTELSYAPGSTPPPPLKVTRTGDYYLYQPGSSEPVIHYGLARGDRFGFRKRPDGSVVAVVVQGGEEAEIELPGRSNGSYYWKYQDQDD